MYAIDTDNVDLALRLAGEMRAPWLGLNYRLRFDAEPLMGLTGVAEHPLYAHGLLLAASQAAFMGDVATATTRADQALAEAARLEDSERLVVASYVWSIHGTLASARGATHDAAEHLERAVEASRAADRQTEVAYNLASAATFYVMAGDTSAALALATEGLDLARQVQMPSLIVFSSVALAGALVVDDAEQSRALLHEAMQLMGSTVGYETWTEVVQAAIISARLGDRSQTIALAGPAIRHLHWISDRPLLGAILNLVAHVLASTDPNASAVLQGAARTLAISAMASDAREAVNTAQTPDTQRSSSHFDFVTQLRRTTTGMLRDALGESRLRELRKEGELLDRDQAAAYALDAINNATRNNALGSNIAT
jgi:hypothetical protein